ncbi:hypothetical protein KSX_30140 [Ktedonospora formicarum]|uniref:Uncharacterized protein n=1 Tax=Ktedonospora formicarum TaxID=2778364 RepID=A0A8J3HZI3_9CHLR|nr:hypothetical protein KSX_30140 [Ktedonospora formicarum]
MLNILFPFEHHKREQHSWLPELQSTAIMGECASKLAHRWYNGRAITLNRLLNTTYRTLKRTAATTTLRRTGGP